uniref:Putative secreted protein n=1 Tax=Anopheles darlingi TaxID=43151 RepID=A0A2M4D6K2_ANODA
MKMNWMTSCCCCWSWNAIPTSCAMSCYRKSCRCYRCCLSSAFSDPYPGRAASCPPSRTPRIRSDSWNAPLFRIRR